MKALIIAAGQGIRLRDISASKPMAMLNGRPLIAHVIDAATTAGASELVVVTGYEAERLERFLSGYAREQGLAITCVRNPDWTGSNGLSVLAAEPLLQERFLLLMSDHLFDPGIARDLIATLPDTPGVVLAIDRRLDNPMVDLEDVTRVQVGPRGEILRIGKLIERYDAYDTGVFLASPLLPQAMREDIAAGGRGSISEAMQRLAARGQALTFDIDGRFWLDVDDGVAFAHAEREAGRIAQPARLQPAPGD